MNRVLVNADDLCLHPDIDRGILQCVESGVVQSVSFSVLGENLDWNRLRDLQQAGVRVGLHVTLVDEPWGTDGRLIPHWKALVKGLLVGGRSLREAVAGEINHQLRLALDNGITPSHIDSHQHVHAFGGVWGPCLRIAQELNIRIRVPACPTLGVIKKNVAGVGLQALSTLRGHSVRNWLPCLGLSYAGHNTADILARELEHSKGRDVELVMHPGVNTPALESRYADWKFDWTGERDALLSSHFRDALAANGFELSPFLPVARPDLRCA